MPESTVYQLKNIGQSIWLDNISRSLISSGKLKKFIQQGVSGLTSNPTIFDKAVRLSNDYDERIRDLCSGKGVFDIYDSLTVSDIQDAADLFMPVYEATNGCDGYVSLEVDPRLAAKTEETIKEARRLYHKVNRPNLMLKIPATPAGFKAIEKLISEAININATLIFSLKQYIDTASAYINGVKKLIDNGGDPRKVHSVASCFVSRIDTKIDNIIDEFINSQKEERIKQELNILKGKAAVANVSRIYGKYSEIFSSNDFKQLEDKGVNAQRALWGSTSTKNPDYNDLKYVEELIAKDTVNTVPEATLELFLDHGKAAKEALAGKLAASQQIINDLHDFNIDIDQICNQLLSDGLLAFESSFNSLLESVDKKSKQLSVPGSVV